MEQDVLELVIAELKRELSKGDEPLYNWDEYMWGYVAGIKKCLEILGVRVED